VPRADHIVRDRIVTILMISARTPGEKGWWRRCTTRSSGPGVAGHGSGRETLTTGPLSRLPPAAALPIRRRVPARRRPARARAVQALVPPPVHPAAGAAADARRDTPVASGHGRGRRPLSTSVGQNRQFCRARLGEFAGRAVARNRQARGTSVHSSHAVVCAAHRLTSDIRRYVWVKADCSLPSEVARTGVSARLSGCVSPVASTAQDGLCGMQPAGRGDRPTGCPGWRRLERD
jgi:hypothetical protein